MSKPTDKREPLDELTEAFVNLPVPAGPDAEVKQRLLKTLAQVADEAVTVSPDRNWRKETMSRMINIAAVLLILAGATAYLLPRSNGWQGAAYAAMIEQLQEVQSMSYMTRVLLPQQTGMAVQTHVLNQNQIREEMLLEAEPKGEPKVFAVLIHNNKLGKALTLNTKEKSARIIEMSEQLAGTQTNFMQRFRKMRLDYAEYLGKEKLGGKNVLKYKYHKPDGHYVVWLEPDTQLPVKAVIADVADSNETSSRFELTDFVWNPKLDKSLFSLEGADPEMAKVLYGDLRIEIMPVNQLPKQDAE